MQLTINNNQQSTINNNNNNNKMVKNTKGGKGSKSIARKSVTGNNNNTIMRIPENELELFAVVTKFYGNMCDVMTCDGKNYKCHIRGKFKSRQKRNAFISLGKIVLVGFRHFEEPNYVNTDLLHVYDLSEYSQFSYLPKHDMSSLIAFHNNNTSGGSSHVSCDNDVTFDNDCSTEEPTSQNAVVAMKRPIETIKETNDEDDDDDDNKDEPINIDDI